MIQTEFDKKRDRSSCFLWGCGGCAVVSLMAFVLVVGITAVIFAAWQPISPKKWKTDSSVDIDMQTISGYERDSDRYIAFIPVHGIIMNSEKSSGIVSPEVFSEMMKHAEDDPDNAGVILDIDSPGGEVNAADEIYRRILAFREKTGRPVIALMRSVAASGGYYVAAGCDKIVAGEMTLTGSIGVIISAYNFSGLMEMLGVEGEVYKSGKMKDMLSPVRRRTKEEVAVVQELVDECYHEFASIVSKARNIPLEKITGGPIGDGRVYHGKKALEYGMVDQIGYLDEAVALCEKTAKEKEGSLSVIRFKQSPALLDILLGMDSPLRNGFKVNIGLPLDREVRLEPGKLYYLPVGL